MSPCKDSKQYVPPTGFLEVFDTSAKRLLSVLANYLFLNGKGQEYDTESRVSKRTKKACGLGL